MALFRMTITIFKIIQIMKLKKTLLTLALTLGFFTMSVSTAFAQPVTNYKIPNPTKYENLEQVLSALASLIRPLFILAFGAMIIYGGWVRLTSKGDSDKVSSSVKIITAAATGFAIAVLAPTILNFVTGLLGVEGLGGLT